MNLFEKVRQTCLFSINDTFFQLVSSGRRRQ